MSVSGFKDQFLFYGFLPKKERELNNTLSLLSNYSFSLVFFSPSNKINLYIKKFKTFFSGRQILIAREMTKVHETFYRDEIDNLGLFKDTLKGELTIVISAKKIAREAFNKSKIINKIKKYLKKLSLKDTVDLIYETEKVNKKEIYKLCLEIKNDKNS